MPRTILGLAVLLIALAPAACDDSTTAPERGPYLEPTSPENVVQNLAIAYDREEAGEYAKLLAPDFIFRFQPGDAQTLGIDTWNRSQDSTGTAALFGTTLVGDIRMDLIHGPSTVSGESFPGVAGEVRTIRISPTQLEVDITGGSNAGTTLQVDGDIQDMFFRRGNAAADEDTTRWFLLEWRDIPALAVTEVWPGSAPAAIESISWGIIKTLFVE